MKKTILDVCCGGKMFYFDKNDPRVLFCDKRVMEPTIIGKGRHGRVRSCIPDVKCSFEKLPFPDESYNLVIFDPPHLVKAGENSWLAKTYGSLEGDWRAMLRKGFAECFRVLKPNGTLIFKWNETDIKVSEILKLAPVKPVFGNRSGKASKTHWICFVKEGAE